jgi:sigma-E factor negative regulatory protein RseC
MENPRGRVISVSNTASSPRALVEVNAVVECARCAEGKGCGAGLLGSSAGNRRVNALISPDLNVRAGDEVSIELAPKNLLHASLIVYGGPLSGAIVAALIAYAAGLSDSYAALAAIAGLSAGLLLARRYLRSARCLRRFTPMVVAQSGTTPSAVSF